MKTKTPLLSSRNGLGVTLGLSLALAAGAAMGAETIKLGVVAPITGFQAILGVSEQHGVQMAVDEINSSGGIAGKKIEVDLADAGMSNATAVSATIKVIDDKVNAIIGLPVSTQNIAMAPILKKGGIPTFFASTANVVTTLGAPMWRVVVADGVSLPIAIKFVKDTLHKTKIGVMNVNDEYGNGSAQLAEESAKSSGLSVVAHESFAASIRDFSPQLLKIKNAGAEVLMVYAYPVSVAAILKQRVSLGLTMPVIGANPIAQASVLHLVTDAEANGAHGVGSIDPNVSPSPAVKVWLAKFESKFHTPADTYAAAYYDAVMLLKKAVEEVKGATDPASIRKGLLTVKNYQGISSPFTCAPDGNCAHVAWIVQDKGKTPVIIKEVREPGY